MTAAPRELSDKAVLMVIALGIILILLAIVIGVFLTSRAGFSLPNWAENVFVAIATASVLKLGDCLSTLVALVTGKQAAALGDKLAASQPVAPPAVEERIEEKLP